MTRRVRMGLFIVAIPVCVFAYRGVLCTLHTKSCVPILAKLNAPLPIYPECRLVEEKWMSIAGSGDRSDSCRTKRSIEWSKRIILDASDIPLGQGSADRQMEHLWSRAAVICPFYVSYMKTCGLDIGGGQSGVHESPAPFSSGSELKYFRDDAEPIRGSRFRSLSTGGTGTLMVQYEQAQVDGRKLIKIDFWVREDGFTDGPKSARTPGEDDWQKWRPAPQEVRLVYPEISLQIEAVQTYAGTILQVYDPGRLDAILKFLLERASGEAIDKFVTGLPPAPPGVKVLTAARMLGDRMAEIRGLNDEGASALIEKAKERGDADSLCIAVWLLPTPAGQARAADSLAATPDKNAVRVLAMRLQQASSTAKADAETQQLKRSLVKAIERCTNTTFPTFDASDGEVRRVIEYCRGWLAQNGTWVGYE